MIREQLVLDLPHRAALGADDFLVSDCNRLAVELIDAWPDWSAPTQLLVGPAASGKTHLTRVWQARSGAVALTGADSDVARLEAAATGSTFVLEDADRIEVSEKTLFHLLNLIKERGHSLLITARQPPQRWGIGLPDLSSRLNGLPLVDIGSPDGPLLKTVMLKQFADRQLNVEPKVLNYGKTGEGELLKEGMVIAIEPMVTVGDWKLKLAKDGHSYNTKDGSLFCHFEDTIAITKKGPKVLTR